MHDLEKSLKDAVYSMIGAAATLVEKSGETFDAMVEKGQETVERSRTYGEELKRKAQEAVDQYTTVEIDVTRLTPEQRKELRRQLDLMDQEEAAAQHEENEENG